MGAFQKIAIAILTISFFTFVALFGQLPALRKTPIGWLQRLLCLHMPSRLRRVDHTLTGGVVTLRSRRLRDYLFFEKNPVVLIIFLIILTGSAVLFLWNAVALLPVSLLLPVVPLLVTPYVFTHLAVTHRAHLITPATHPARMRDYPFDRTLFHPGTFCRTCALPKPARSKHCSLCGTCVAKADHHCPWFNNCIGRGNYRHFLGMLLSVGVLQIYGAYLAWTVLAPAIPARRSSSVFSRAFGDDVVRALAAAVDTGGLSIAGVGALAAATAALPLGLLAYHAYLIWAGTTTNEAAKWGDWKEDVGDGYAFRAERAALRAHVRRRRKGGERGAGLYAMGEEWNPALDGLEEEDEGREVPWLVTSDQVLVRTNDGRPPMGQEAVWTRVRSMREVDNIYDLGGWRNLMEVLQGR